jgi:hypothetical protein
MRAGPALLALAFSACIEVVAPLPEGASPFTPGPVYREWWRQVEECSGKTGDFDAVSWYVVPGDIPFRIPTIDKPLLGYWNSATNRIVLLEWVPSATELVRHEMLHALLRRADHPYEYFEQRCGELIRGPGLMDDAG